MRAGTGLCSAPPQTWQTLPHHPPRLLPTQRMVRLSVLLMAGAGRPGRRGRRGGLLEDTGRVGSRPHHSGGQEGGSRGLGVESSKKPGRRDTGTRGRSQRDVVWLSPVGAALR